MLLSPHLNQAISVLAGLGWWADVAFWAIMLVARCCVNITIGMRAFWTSTSGRTEYHEGAALRAPRTGGIAWAPRPEGAKAHLWALLSVARPCDLFELSVLTFLSTILGHHVLDEPGCLLTTTTPLSAWRPCSEVTNAIRTTGGCVVAGLGVTR